ncbi:hypothetical protein PSTG_15585 [Puccinia striiformis f. sp. tritici PST-78]|uniref:Transaldolase n=1 Tax=Puccinia striiformis f. sp. tritici PST-78 TaxID=1165861 RepID=A0A0L0UVC3_9BASI|nr:hypothetical protein PSTG_15585 [Puccinia striiformis f. sp. tritici PST-78]
MTWPDLERICCATATVPVQCNAQTTPDATTNPFLIFAAVEKPTCAQLIDVAVKYGKSQGVLVLR